MANSLIQLRIDDKLKAEAAVIAMREMSKTAEANGISDMTLDEINAEINAARNEA